VSQLENMLSQPSEIITFLANSLPAQVRKASPSMVCGQAPRLDSFFVLVFLFIQILISNTTVLMVTETLRAYPLGVAFFRQLIGPRLTKKDRPYLCFYSVEEPPEFWHAETFCAKHSLFHGFLCLRFNRSNNLLLSLRLLTYYGVWLSLPVHPQLPARFRHRRSTLEILFSFYAGKYDNWSNYTHWLVDSEAKRLCGPSVGTPVGYHNIFTITINSEHSRVSSYLPSRDCVIHDTRNARERINFDFVKNAYLQPALRNDPMNGITTPLRGFAFRSIVRKVSR
jgi:hypothetical protein